MGRIIFYNPFPKEQLSGGIKTVYQHCGFLNQMGIPALIHAADGPAVWLEDSALTSYVQRDITLTSADILVFPEVVSGVVEETMKKTLPCRKVMFCQGTYIYLGFYIDFKTIKSWGVEAVAVPGWESKRALESVYGSETLPITVIPAFIDREAFYPPILPSGVSRQDLTRQKPSILSFCQKWAAKNWPYENLLQGMLKLKYPEFSDVPWIRLDQMSIQQAGDAMRDAALCLSLAKLEGFGLTSLEAMACETPVVGFHGGGGLDYAKSENGYWHSPEDLEGVIDSLASILRGILQGDDAALADMQQKVRYGYSEAQIYTDKRTKDALRNFYAPFLGLS